MNLARDGAWDGEAMKAWRDMDFLNRVSPRFTLLTRMVQCAKIRESNIVLQGFDEVAVLPFLFRARRARNRVGLVLTNNISKERFDRSRRVLTSLLRLIFQLGDRIFYHSDHEFALIRNYVTQEQNLLAKCRKLKYHLLGKLPPSYPIERNLRTISFFGPVMEAKPWGPICNLIQHDSRNHFTYRFYNIQPKIVAEVRNKLGSNCRLEFIAEYQTQQKYLESIASSGYVFLPHNELFAGKLSGILCDSVACGTPVISDCVEPVIELSKRYGKIGYIFEFNSDPDWPGKFLRFAETNAEYYDFQAALKRIRHAHTEQTIIEEFLRDF
jgi:hypothetical protein